MQCDNDIPEKLEFLESFRKMVNDCITLGMDRNVYTLKKLIPLCFEHLKYHIESDDVKYNAIYQSWKKLASLKLSMKIGERLESPFIRNPYFMGVKDALKIKQIRENAKEPWKWNK